MTSIFESRWEFIDAADAKETSGPLTICAGLEDLACVFSADDSTVNISRDEAIKAARLMASAVDLASAVEQLIDILLTDRDFARGYHQQLEQASRVLSRAYGVRD